MTSKGSKLVATVVSGHTFTVDTRYELKDSKILGRGSYGVVTTATDKLQHGKIAIKRIRPFANDEWDARHTLREIRLLKLLGPHPNIITLYDLSLFEDKTELYMMMELMDCDLHQIIQSKQSLSDMHHKCFAKQMLEGIKAMHDIGVFHRDLKPGNILVSKDCKLRITDFGLARFVDEATAIGENSLNPLTEYVVTRWYRCPELLLAPNRPYNEAIDMWAVGCILAELLRRKPLFPGKSHANQVQLIFEVIGYSASQNLGFEVSTEASSFLEKRCRSRGQSLASVIPQASATALQLISRLLAVDPVARPTASQALAFDYLRDAEILCDYEKQYLQRPPSTLFDFESEKYTLEQLRELIVGEVRLSASQNMELRAKLGMTEDDLTLPDSKRRTEVSHTGIESNSSTRTVPSNAPALTQTNQTATMSGATTQRRLSSSDNKLKYAEGPRDSEGKLLRRASSEDKSNTTIVSDISAQEAQLARDQQMDTNPTQQKTLARAMSAASNVATLQKEVEAVKLPKSSSTTTLNSATSSHRQSLDGGRPPINNNADSRMIVDRSVLDQHTANYGNVLSTVSRGPKTPSPKKMDIIMQKGMRAKKSSLEGHVSGSDGEDKGRYPEIRGATDREEKGIAATDAKNSMANDSSNSNSSFLKNRHFGFMRSSSTSTNSSRPVSAADPNASTLANSAANNVNSRNDPAGLSSLLSQFSGRYQSLSSKAKSAANAPSGHGGPLDRAAMTSDVLTKPVNLKSRSNSTPITQSHSNGGH